MIYKSQILVQKTLIDKNETMTECIHIVEDQENESDKRVDYMTYACKNGQK